MDAVYPVLQYLLWLSVAGLVLFAISYLKTWLFENDRYRGYNWAIRSQTVNGLDYLENKKKANRLLERIYNEARNGEFVINPVSHSMLASYYRWRQLNTFALKYSATTVSCFTLLVVGMFLA